MAAFEHEIKAGYQSPRYCSMPWNRDRLMLLKLITCETTYAVMLFMPIARSTSLYSSLTFVTAEYSLGTHSHTTTARSVAMTVAII